MGGNDLHRVRNDGVIDPDAPQIEIVDRETGGEISDEDGDGDGVNGVGVIDVDRVWFQGGAQYPRTAGAKGAHVESAGAIDGGAGGVDIYMQIQIEGIAEEGIFAEVAIDSLLGADLEVGPVAADIAVEVTTGEGWETVEPGLDGIALFRECDNTVFEDRWAGFEKDAAAEPSGIAIKGTVIDRHRLEVAVDGAAVEADVIDKDAVVESHGRGIAGDGAGDRKGVVVLKETAGKTGGCIVAIDGAPDAEEQGGAVVTEDAVVELWRGLIALHGSAAVSQVAFKKAVSDIG